MRIFHPELGQYAEVDDEAFTDTYAERGWVEAEEPPAAPPPPAPVVEPDPEPVVVEKPAELSVKQVLLTVGDSPHVAAQVLEAEKAGQNRKTLVAALERIVTPADPATTEAPAAESTEENQA